MKVIFYALVSNAVFLMIAALPMHTLFSARLASPLSHISATVHHRLRLSAHSQPITRLFTIASLRSSLFDEEPSRKQAMVEYIGIPAALKEAKHLSAALETILLSTTYYERVQSYIALLRTVLYKINASDGQMSDKSLERFRDYFALMHFTEMKAISVGKSDSQEDSVELQEEKGRAEMLSREVGRQLQRLLGGKTISYEYLE